MPKDALEWVASEDMTEKEKESSPSHKTTGGYLKLREKSGRRQLWWDGLGEREKDAIRSLPNFDPQIFLECTGIRVDGLDDRG